ncbi:MULTISPECIES: hypothetical protein [unclassified Brachybacterium]|uniref:hypothetical protein n=1 Tax=unclassified Brachybacterium TaxID=2623841 RepID=UPI000C7FB976|nr:MULTISPECIES: hypothetical protein [unclassified Brachybacterium]PMC75642.1 hypothetical protein CJ197_07860 [Brachybacterium sp. UMB0905]
MTETTAQAAQEQPTVYTAYEIDFMLSLRPTENGEVTREQVGLRSAPEEAREFVTAAVTSGLRARGKVERTEDGQWLLAEEGQVIATALTAADRWMGVALAEGDAMRMAFIIKAAEAVIMLTQDELDSFMVTAMTDPAQVPGAVNDIVSAFLAGGNQRTVSLRRTEMATKDQPVPMMFHVEEDGSWKIGHLPLDEEGILSVSDVTSEGVLTAVTALWEEGRSEAP